MDKATALETLIVNGVYINPQKYIITGPLEGLSQEVGKAVSALLFAHGYGWELANHGNTPYRRG